MWGRFAEDTEQDFYLIFFTEMFAASHRCYFEFLLLQHTFTLNTFCNIKFFYSRRLRIV